MRKNPWQKGFTLVEVLTTLFIIAILSGIIFANYRQSNRLYNLLRAANKLAQDIRVVQQMALTTKQCCGGIIPYGYGVRLNTGGTNYLLYADIDGSEDYNDGDAAIETVNFESGTTINSMQIIIDGNPAQNVNSITINFKPPDPTTKINGDSLIVQGMITLLLQGRTKSIKVNKAGLIWVE